MILLKSTNRHNRFALLDPTNNKLSWKSRSQEFNPTRHEIHGTVGKLPFHTVGLYRLKNVLHLWIDGYDFPMEDNVIITLETLALRRHRLTISQNGKLLYSFRYFRPINIIPKFLDPTPYIEEEEIDFGVFVHNVANDPVRRHNIYRERTV